MSSGGDSRARPHPQPAVADLWPALAELVPPGVIDPRTWTSLAPLVTALPGPVVGFERPIDDTHASEWGFPLPRWQRANALMLEDELTAHVTPLVRAWSEHGDLDRLCDLQMYTWDIVDGDPARLTPCVFLRVDRQASEMAVGPAWKQMLRGYASALRGAGRITEGIAWSDVSDRLEEAAGATPLDDVASVGVYLGRPGCPIRLTVRAATRPWPDHPAWTHVDEVVRVAGRDPRGAIVAFAPGDDPGDTWHVPVLVDRSPQPADALRPLLSALVDRGLSTGAAADAIAQFDVRRPLNLAHPTLDGVPATATLWAAPERVKVTVDATGWRGAKVDLLARVIWRSVTGDVLIDH